MFPNNKPGGGRRRVESVSVQQMLQIAGELLSAFLILGCSILTNLPKYLSQIENAETLAFLNELEHENEKYFNFLDAKVTLELPKFLVSLTFLSK